MTEKFLEKYVDMLIERQNTGVRTNLMNLYSRADYYKLLRPVIDVVKDFSDHGFEKMCDVLSRKSDIYNKIKIFTIDKGMAPGLLVSFGTMLCNHTICIGNSQEISINKNGRYIRNLIPIDLNAIFDLASITKLFTGIVILKLVEMGYITLDDKVTDYSPQFKNLKNVSIFDLLSFGVPLVTDGRIDNASSYEEARERLFNTKIDETSKNEKPYADIGAMILKYVIEDFTGMSLYKVINKFILDELNMKNTFVNVPGYFSKYVVSTNYDAMYDKDGNYKINTSAEKGIANDSKAQIMGHSEGNLSGHAGLFSSSWDMVKLAKGIINRDILNDIHVRYLSKNRTGRYLGLDDKGNPKYVQHLGFMCYSKNPNLRDSEVFYALSGNSIGSAGWTGTQLTIDPTNGIYAFLGSNRSHNRISSLDKVHEDKVITDSKGKRIVMLPNGREMIDSSRFGWDRDASIIRPILELSIQYKFLEDMLFLNEKEKESPKQLFINMNNYIELDKGLNNIRD